MLLFGIFVLLLVLTLADPNRFARFKAKSWQDWCLDSLGLSTQGLLIPLVQGAVIVQIYRYLLPTYQASIEIPPLWGFLISFVLVDYIYYWNHRLLHTGWFWPIHQVHHTVSQMDVLATSRNTLWSSFLIAYLWIHALFVYLLQDATFYLVGVSLTYALDLWRHSEIDEPNWLRPWVQSWLILPRDHAWHHATTALPVYFGGNLKIWDRFHNTQQFSLPTGLRPIQLGIEIPLTLIQRLIWPFSKPAPRGSAGIQTDSIK
jgi:sterol desaturase/sphingolipid hydroxylase (fatty acid hydroxylase superfamily)